MSQFSHVEIAGLPIARIGTASVLDHVFSELNDGRGGWLVTANLDFLQRADASQAARELYSQADLILADGMPLLWVARILGKSLPERVAGSDLVWSLAERAAVEGKSLYLLGGDPGAAPEAADRFQDRFPSLKILGESSPMLSARPTSGEIESIRSVLEKLRPDIVYVAFGSPKQEFVIDALRRVLPATWMMGCGISLSFVAGHVARAPNWMQRLGLEWLHRLFQDPRRLGPRYVIGNIPFAFKTLWATWRSRRKLPPP